MATEAAIEKLGRYEILSELGQGAMGVVYKAIDPLIDRIVAIKTVKFDGSREDCASFEERFYREAKSAGRLNHPHIVTIYDVGKSDNTAYIAMEYLEGQQLKEILDVHTAMSIDRIVDIVAQIAEGLAYAHKNGIVHRDIKPANVMLVHGDTVKITDFGIARMATSTGTLAGTVLGSPRYMAPEQVVGQVVDGRSDLFSLGVVLYEMLTGESPFDGENINTTMYRIVNEAPVPPKTLTPRIPETFDYIVAKALAKHPDARYQSAAEFAHDLRNYQDLTIPRAAITMLYHPITVERRATAMDRRTRAKPSAGEATLVMAPSARPALGMGASPAALATTLIQTPALNGASKRRQKSLLIVASLVLLMAFGLIVTRDKPAPPPESVLPALTASTPDFPRIDVPPVDTALTEKPVPDKPLSSAQLRSTDPFKHVPPEPRADPTASALTQPKRNPVVSDVTPPAIQASPPKGNAKLSFAVTPWGDVYLDGKRMGASPPLKELNVPAGKHKIEIRNLNFAPYSETLHLQADSTKKLKYRFE